MMLNNKFRENLRAAMRAHPDKALTICHRAGYDYSYVRKVLSGARPNPTLQFVDSMAGALGLDPLDLLK
jgi:transcriptional regulator with XRE-family HTH domain